ncbi:MAG TPA: 4,5-DOPA dioxygenase extradiol [Bdellovibrionales bacterium]|nr:MAG: 4,5-DOPA dioxygenase extradiol [Bdellovibrionales bacterium GWB1_52_6]OFZ04613.1 MAG: 4,5-DOPA dioxygenase extradiol [Bdellovibrionales bacterium GWA1_52_35]OFZ32931.1 MAG: 4,5-DOPA dioxygenase extradiol [Bdellovibrionales bacterium GWC1_52_8]HAR44313.1 4,5-DOPA dioxygenase extradiol [Bdellovibrionales bacterium]HCM40015.1 4,5-DOPA dioxygenase extradiol [Bdellovibrionales bacterium]
MTSKRMPVLFIGHGSPVNAISDNPYTQRLRELGREIPKPQAILCISAHWMSEGSWITGMHNPKTIHDFYGFPKALFDIQYPAPGSPVTAAFIQKSVDDPKIRIDQEMWGIDHGTWSVLRHMYPKADIPVLQLSLYMEQPGDYHVKLGQQLRLLREQGVLIIGSGNIVHNLRQIRWEEDAQPYDWAVEFDEWSRDKILNRDIHSLARNYNQDFAGRISVPTPDHYYPLLYVLGASEERDVIRFEYEGIQNASISMRCLSFGLVR